MAPPYPPTVGRAPGNPGRASYARVMTEGPEMAPHTPQRSAAPLGAPRFGERLSMT
jgi:hypothetical protein